MRQAVGLIELKSTIVYCSPETLDRLKNSYYQKEMVPLQEYYGIARRSTASERVPCSVSVWQQCPEVHCFSMPWCDFDENAFNVPFRRFQLTTKFKIRFLKKIGRPFDIG